MTLRRFKLARTLPFGGLQTEPSDLAHIKIYTYADQEQGQVLIQQVSYPIPYPQHQPRDMVLPGKQPVYEPIRDG